MERVSFCESEAIECWSGFGLGSQSSNEMYKKQSIMCRSAFDVFT